MTLDSVISELLTKQGTYVVFQDTSELPVQVYGEVAFVGSQERHEQETWDATTADDCESLAAYLGERTDNVYTDEDSLKLQLAYEQVAYNRFPDTILVRVIDSIDWCNKSPVFFKQAIELALELELPLIASRLADIGHRTRPMNSYLERAARVLAPPKIVERNRPPQEGLSASMVWLQSHAREYRGTWVAIRAGELIDFASSRMELISRVGDVAGDSGVLITRIP